MRNDLLERFPYEECDSIIQKLGLHQNYPVWPTSLYELLNVEVCCMSLPSWVKAFSIKQVGIEHSIVVLDEKLSNLDVRHAIFHEAGHLLAHRSGRPHACATHGRVSREEVEADLIGAYLSAPAWAVKELFYQGYNTQQVAATLEITTEMLELRYQLLTYNK